MAVWFTSDTHFLHVNIIKHCNRPFSSLDEMHEALIANWNSVVARGDLVYHIGDFALTWNNDTSPVDKLLKRLHGTKHLICGNHDRDAVKKSAGWHKVGYYDRINVDGQKIVLFHYAMKVWHGSHRGTWQLYGHSHGSLKDDPHSLQLDVGVDVWNFTPVCVDQIRPLMLAKTWLPVDAHGGTGEEHELAAGD